MKKSLLILSIALFAFFGFSFAKTPVSVQATGGGQVVFHYQKWDADYASVGLWVWDTGTGGSSNALEKASVDDFGAVINITIGSDATTMGLIPIAKEIGNDNRWNNKDSKDGANLSLDVTAAAGGATMHVYFLSGGNTIFVADPTKANILVVYFTATEVYEANIGIHAWGSNWVQNEAYGSWGEWGNPTKIFTAEFTTPQGKLGKAGWLQTNVGTDANFLVYAGNDATKKTGDIAQINKDIVAGGIQAVYVAGDKYVGVDKAFQFAEENFAFKFIAKGGEKGVFTGTLAASKTSILIKFSADVQSAFYNQNGTPIVTTYQKYEIVDYEYIPTGTGGITIDTTVYPAYAPQAIPSNVLGRVVFHYQKWDSDYSDVGLWTWGTGTNGTSAPVTKAGVDSFGAVMEVYIGAGATEIGLIPLADSIGTDDRWAYRETPDGQHITFDVTPIVNGTVTEIHIYYFQGGHQTYFVADPAKANVITLYYNQTGTYESNIGLYTWGSWDKKSNSVFGTDSVPMIPVFKSPDGVPGYGVMNTFDPASEENWIGYLVYGYVDSSNEGKKSGDINNDAGMGFDGMVAGSVKVVYVGFADKTVSLDHDRFVMEMLVETEKVPIYDYVDYELIEYPRVEVSFAGKFTLLKNGVDVTNTIISIDFNTEKDVVTEFVLQLSTALDNTATYVLRFNNGKEGIDLQEAEIELDMDKTKPVFTFISAQQVSIVAGKGWDPSLWPNVRVTDDRDGNITNRVYVKSGEGTLDTNTPGTYEIKLTAADSWGNEAQAVFTVVVTAPETGCGARNAGIAIIGFFGILANLIVFKRWA